MMASRQSPRRLRITLRPPKTKPNCTSSMRIDPRSHVSERKRTRPEHTQCKCVQISLLTADRLFFFPFRPHFISIIITITVSHRSHSVYILIGTTNESLILPTAPTFSDFFQTSCPHSSSTAFLSSLHSTSFASCHPYWRKRIITPIKQSINPNYQISLHQFLFNPENPAPAKSRQDYLSNVAVTSLCSRRWIDELLEAQETLE